MTISLKTHKRLWAHSGEECAFPACQQPLFVGLEGEDEGETIVGKECHIVSNAEAGPRAPRKLSGDEKKLWQSLIDNRDGYGNLILLCGVHHDVIDGDESHYTVERVVDMKRDHERAVRERRGRDRQRRDEIEIRYAAIVDEWAARIGLDRWDARMSSLASDAVIERETLDRLEKTRFWLHNRVWPRQLPTLEDALLNFRAIESDLHWVVVRYATEDGGAVFVDRVYREVTGARATPENVEFLEQRSDYYMALAGDLAIELTRAVNLVCERVRQELWPDYRLAEGHATIGIGFDMSLSYGVVRPLYPLDVSGVPYPGLNAFAMGRHESDGYLGQGSPPGREALPGHRVSD